MENNLEQTLNYYCNRELETFKNSLYYEEMSNLAQKKGLKLYCEVASPENDNKHIYLSFQIENTNHETVTTNDYDGEHLTDATLLIQCDRKQRFMFYSWEDDKDFIDSIKWVITTLK